MESILNMRGWMMPASLGILHAVPRTVLFSTGAVACGLTRHVDPFIATDGAGHLARHGVRVGACALIDLSTDPFTQEDLRFSGLES